MRWSKLLSLLIVILIVISACGPGEEAAPAEPAAENTPARSTGAEPESATEAPAAPAGEPAQAAPTAAVRSTGGDASAEWTILMYLNADDDILEEDIFTDLNEMERAGSTDAVQIVAQIDRFQGAFDGDGDWTSTKRFFVGQDEDLGSVASQELEDLGEVDSGDPATLADFIAWGIQNYPANKYVLFMSDHGGGWTGGWTDPDPVEGAQLSLVEIRDGIAQGLEAGGVEQFELIDFDACLMGQAEVFAAIAPYARYGVASEEVIPAMGEAYTAWLTELINNPQMDTSQLAQIIVDTYIVEDSRILDDGQRASLFGPGSADQIAEAVYREVTLSAVDLAAFPAVMSAVDNLSAALVGADQAQVAEARTYAQSYENIFGEGVPPSFLDVVNFAALAAEITGSPEVAAAAGEVQSAVQQALVAEKHGDKRPGSSGISIFFPNSDVYAALLEAYTYTTAGFPEASSWDDFLAYHYYGGSFEPSEGQVVTPPAGAELTAPGAGPIDLLPVEISAESVAEGETVQITSQATGDNIAYIYTFAGYYDETSDAVLVADMDFVYTDGTREVDGIYYPDFSGGPVDLQWDWSPVIYTLNDGSASGFALFEPDDYGAPDESPTYAVYGTWQYADGSEADNAIVYFADGEMLDAYAFSGEGGSGAPRQINPSDGDQFTVLDTIYTQDENGEILISYQDGETFTFSGTWFTWEEAPAPAGSYVVGFIAVDFDGNMYFQFAPVEVN